MSYFLISILIFLSDQMSKNYIIKNILPLEFKEKIKNRFYITNIKNEGAFLGFLKNNKVILKLISILSLLISFFALIYSIKNNYKSILKLAFAFVFGGALGNIYDRFKKGFVTDFLYIKFKKLPIFNIADIFVFLGGIIILIDSIFFSEN